MPPFPPYISWLGHGSANSPPPGVFTGATAHLFAFDTDITATQTLVDTLLNPAVEPAVRYESRVASSFVTFIDIKRCASAVEAIGYLPGRESALWLVLRELHPSNPDLDRDVLWAPYVFINYDIGMVIGREVWGWPKVIGDVVMPTVSGDPATYSCSTTVFPQFSPNTEGQSAQLLEVTSNIGIDLGIPIWFDAVTAARSIIAGLAGLSVGDTPNPLGDDLVIAAVALKQFRDSNDPTSACFQAVTNSPIQITQFIGGGLHIGDFTLSVMNCESHQIISDFLGEPFVPGQGSTQLPITFGAWLQFDFQALPGAVVAP